jgi:hypothetical protein
MGSLTLDSRPAARRAVDVDRAADRFDSVDQSGEPRAARRHCATLSVVADDHLEPRVVLGGPDLDPRCLGVLGSVGQRLRGDVVGRHLDRLLEACGVKVEPPLDGHRRPASQQAEGRVQAPSDSTAG